MTTTPEHRAPMKVFVTIDVEWWPRTWPSRHRDFSELFERYIMGSTTRGTVGLPFQLQLARDYGLRFVFFVESLFASEFGIGPLSEIVQMILEAGQDVQLHAHPEWVRHGTSPILDLGRRYFFRDLSVEEQLHLIEAARANLVDAGANRVRAFRAGSFSGNMETLMAVGRAGLDLDSSVKLGSTPRGFEDRVDGYVRCNGVTEYPLSTFEDWPGHSRNVQLNACSSRELLHVLREARRKNWDSAVMLSHSAELLTEDRTVPDWVVVRRFERLCKTLAEQKDLYETAWFCDEEPVSASRSRLEQVRSSPWRTVLRMGEQAVRRLSV